MKVRNVNGKWSVIVAGEVIGRYATRELALRSVEAPMTPPFLKKPKKTPKK